LLKNNEKDHTWEDLLMTHMAVSLIIDFYLGTHDHIMKFAERLSDEQLSHKTNPSSPCIAFYLWHLARWAEDLQAAFPGMTENLSQRLTAKPQIWEAQSLAQQWGFPAGGLGFDETGMEMDEATAANLTFPAKAVLLAYVRQAFAAVDVTVRSISEAEFVMPEQHQPETEEVWKPGNTVGSAILEHLVHDSRHLGMMESLLGIQTGHGTATR
jgi:hypothetical protein